MPFRLWSPRYNFFRREYWWGEVDTRPLGVFRIAFALILLKDALYHLPLARVFYSDAGVLPRAALAAGLARADRFSLMDALPYAGMAAAFFVVWAAVTMALALGWRTRLMSVLNFVLILSLQERNLYVITGADNVLRVMSFWMIFLPLGDYYSLDAVRARAARFLRSRALTDLRAAPAARLGWAFPLRLAQIQFALIYLFTAAAKHSAIWLNGEALHYAFQLKSLTLPSGDWFFAAAPAGLLRLMSYQALVTEAVFFFLMFLPLAQPYLRALGLILGVLLHGGILVLMSIPDFSIVMMAGYLLFCEPEWIAWAERKLRAAVTPASIAQPPAGHPLWLALALTPAAMLTVAPAAGRAGSGPDDWKLRPAGRGPALTGAEAWRHLTGFLPLSRLWNFIFRWAGARRWVWRFAGWSAARLALPAPEEGAAPAQMTVRAPRGARAALGLLLTALMAGVVWWNLAGLDFTGPLAAPPVTGLTRRVIQFSGLWQQWNMFSPYPVLDDGWLQAPGRFEDGATLDLITGQPPSDAVMQRWLFGPDERWKKYVENLRVGPNPLLLKPYAEYFCREYNDVQARPPGSRLATLEFRFRLRPSFPPGGNEQPWQDQLLWKHWCFAEYKY